MNRNGVIPVIIVLLAGLGVGLLAGVHIQKKVVERTMICHDPNRPK